jgi:hypothetical protein
MCYAHVKCLSPRVCAPGDLSPVSQGKAGWFPQMTHKKPAAGAPALVRGMELAVLQVSASDARTHDARTSAWISASKAMRKFRVLGILSGGRRKSAPIAAEPSIFAVESAAARRKSAPEIDPTLGAASEPRQAVRSAWASPRGNGSNGVEAAEASAYAQALRHAPCPDARPRAPAPHHSRDRAPTALLLRPGVQQARCRAGDALP